MGCYLFPSFVFITYIISNIAIYPLADARKTIGKGSTADNAIIECIKQFVSNGKLYDVVLYDGAPISPGPGWILINSPFALLNCYWLFTPVYILITCLLYWRLFGNSIIPTLVLLLLSTSLIFWELMVTGHDLISLGFSFVIIVLLVYKFCSRQKDVGLTKHILFITLFIGIIATSRIVFICLPLLIGMLIWRINPRQAIFVSLIGLFVALMLHGYFYYTNDYYQPLHLLSRGKTTVTMPITFLGAFFTIVMCVAAFFKVKDSLGSLLFWFSLCISVPLVLISFGEFLHVDANFRLWEGANYFVPAIPLFLFYVAHSYVNSNPDFNTLEEKGGAQEGPSTSSIRLRSW
jgi:hypothetical protein